MLKFALSMILSIPLLATAAEITFLNPYPPGGTIDHTIKVLTPDLERRGHSVKTQYYRSCGEALAVLKESKSNHFLNILSTAYEPSNPTAGCVMDANRDRIDLV